MPINNISLLLIFETVFLFLFVYTIPLDVEETHHGDTIVSSAKVNLNNSKNRRDKSSAPLRNENFGSFKNSSFSFGRSSNSSLSQEIDEMMKNLEKEIETFFNETFGNSTFNSGEDSGELFTLSPDAEKVTPSSSTAPEKYRSNDKTKRVKL